MKNIGVGRTEWTPHLPKPRRSSREKRRERQQRRETPLTEAEKAMNEECRRWDLEKTKVDWSYRPPGVEPQQEAGALGAPEAEAEKTRGTALSSVPEDEVKET